MRPVLSDFSLSMRLSDLKRFPIQLGHPGYTAPEILLNMEPTMQSDIFSAGGVLVGCKMSRDHRHTLQKKRITQERERVKLRAVFEIPRVSEGKFKSRHQGLAAHISLLL